MRVLTDPRRRLVSPPEMGVYIIPSTLASGGSYASGGVLLRLFKLSPSNIRPDTVPSLEYTSRLREVNSLAETESRLGRHPGDRDTTSVLANRNILLSTTTSGLSFARLAFQTRNRLVNHLRSRTDSLGEGDVFKGFPSL